MEKNEEYRLVLNQNLGFEFVYRDVKSSFHHTIATENTYF